MKEGGKRRRSEEKEAEDAAERRRLDDSSSATPFALSGSCATNSFLDDTYEPVARTADGRFYYRAISYDAAHTSYYDDDRDDDDRLDNRGSHAGCRCHVADGDL